MDDENWDDDWPQAKPNMKNTQQKPNNNSTDCDWENSNWESSSNKQYQSNSVRNDRNDGKSRWRSDDKNDRQRYNHHESDNDISMEIDRATVGSVIGRGGSNIREMESRFKVRIVIGEKKYKTFFL